MALTMRRAFEIYAEEGPIITPMAQALASNALLVISPMLTFDEQESLKFARDSAALGYGRKDHDAACARIRERLGWES